MGKKKRDAETVQGGFFALPSLLMEHREFRELTPSALKVLMVLISQYKGSNNGDLAATHSMMKDWGGMAEGTLGKSLRELQERDLIIKSRQNRKGREGARCALYALTWRRIDECPGKDLCIRPTIVASRKLSKA
ncbi:MULTISPECIES: MarR family transcriptional regulator [Halomonadaceae]|uniref:MarR family transcriptional regulator n=1 Tax=Halomonadaceae TaxID=28256 RepID=UPI000C3427B8|nr:MarR family transcriptional regulator [Halomonas sp. MES3-P3E]PKG49284.1 MarR family transcriptional regulator [Halomonas sp. MES3-P3E]